LRLSISELLILYMLELDIQLKLRAREGTQ
jgi:hypothetical protein